MSTHVSIHDVAPPFRREVEAALFACAEVGVRPALLVVPHFHRLSKLGDDPNFASWLRRLKSDGHEIFLHGYYHLSEPPTKSAANPWTRWFRQRVVSAGEAEFADLSETEADRRISQGIEELRQEGLSPDGFVAPAWSIPAWGQRLLAKHSFTFTEDHFSISNPLQGVSRPSVVYNFASRTPSRLFSSAAFCRVARPLRRAFPARIAIHPADMNFALLRSELRSLLRAFDGTYVARADSLFV